MTLPFCRRFDLAVEQVDRTDEVGDEARLGIFVDFGRRAGLADDALVHDGDACRERHRLFLVVGDDDEGDAHLVLDVHELELGLFPELLVQGAQGFVEQQHLRLLGERAGERYALALTAGKLVRLAAGQGSQLYQIEERLHPIPALRIGHFFVLQSIADVSLDRHVREQGVGLKHHVDRPLIGRNAGHVLAVDYDASR